MSNEESLESRMHRLETKLRRTQRALGLTVLIAVSGAIVAAGWPQDNQIRDLLRVKQLVVVDDEGRDRIRLGQDPKDTQRRSRAAGLTIFDNKGDERGGFGTMDDGSVVFAMDAPRGVGASMRDRIGLVVYPKGSAHVMLIDNMTRAVAKLQSDGDGGGGVQVFKWDMKAKKVHIKTIGYDGDKRETITTGE